MDTPVKITPRTTVGEVMSRYPYMVEITESVSIALHIMDEHGVRHLPVVKDGRPISVISQREINLALANRETDEERQRVIVGHVCPLKAYMIPSTQLLYEVALHMAKLHIGSAVVSEDGRLAGIFTATDACTLLGQLLTPELELDEE